MSIGLTKSNISILTYNIHCINPQIHWLDAEHIPRNDKERQAIRTVVKNACDLDRMVFSTAPISDPATNECTVPGKVKLTTQEFVHQAPIYFQFAHFSQCRSLQQEVHSDLSRARQETPCGKEFQQEESQQDISVYRMLL
jgi:hypothetical protein